MNNSLNHFILNEIYISVIDQSLISLRYILDKWNASNAWLHIFSETSCTRNVATLMVHVNLFMFLSHKTWEGERDYCYHETYSVQVINCTVGHLSPKCLLGSISLLHIFKYYTNFGPRQNKHQRIVNGCLGKCVRSLALHTFLVTHCISSGDHTNPHMSEYLLVKKSYVCLIFFF